MTFSVAALCLRTAETGCVLATSSMAAGARAQFISAEAGVVLSQARSDPRLGVIGLNRLRGGDDARRAPDAMIGASPHAAWRQLAVLDRGGEAVAFTGSECTTAKGELTAPGVVAVDNASRVAGEAGRCGFCLRPYRAWRLQPALSRSPRMRRSGAAWCPISVPIPEAGNLPNAVGNRVRR